METKKIKPITIAYTVGIIIITYIIFIGISIYLFGVNNFISQKTAAIIPYPAAIVGNNIITFSELQEDLEASKDFYQNQNFENLGLRVDFSTPEGLKRLEVKRKNILNRLIENSVIISVAQKRGISLTPDMIDQEVDRKLKEYGGGQSLEENLKKLYGWDISDFKQRIVKPDIYKEKLFEVLKKEDDSYLRAKEKIETAKNDLEEGKNFYEIAGLYSDGESAKAGGKLGWFRLDQMLPEVAVKITDLEKGKISPIIESSIGYHIIKMEDKKNQDGFDIYELSQIYVKTKLFSDWLLDMEKEKNIFIPLSDFYWDKNESLAKFNDEAMSKFEQDLIENSFNDISVMF